MDFDRLDEGKYAGETEAVAALLAACPLSPAERAEVAAEAAGLVRAARAEAGRKGLVEDFLQEYPLSAPEGLALMCLAEALLRTPDVETRDLLIAEKIASADWSAHLGRADSLFVNASTWGLMLTGKLIAPEPAAAADPLSFVKGLAARLGEPIIRRAVAAAMRMMGEQFVLGEDIAAALSRAKAEGFAVCSFDMLGEGARTAADAERYEADYAGAIEAVGAAGAGKGPEGRHGVSVKLSALSLRYEAAQEARVFDELYPRLKRLAVAAARFDMNFALDAEEADRLVLSLKLLERLCGEPELADWRGLGLAVQAYQKRAPAVIAALRGLAQSSGRPLMVRLVKGAYWDAEVKRAQIAGRPDYPVYTTKAVTDLSYLVCAAALIDASPDLFPQFATHNAFTLAAVRALAARKGVAIEHQRLHGMGEALYRAAAKRYPGLPLRVYAPVGGHEDLLPYLVRRLLENGANTSFVHALLDEHVAPEAVAADPVAAVEARPAANPRIPRPPALYGEARRNALGVDLSVRAEVARLAAAVSALDAEPLISGPIIGGELRREGASAEVRAPADRGRTVGEVWTATAARLDEAVFLARSAQGAWDEAGGAERAKVLRAMGDAVEAAMDRLVALLAREAGKTLADAIAEVREAADYCRYYAHIAETRFGAPERLTGPAGEANSLIMRGRGVFACISPWNFPLAIFLGQVTAALAAGDAVVAKPAEQTPLVAAEAVRLYHRSGLDPRLLALLPGEGETIGHALVAHPGIDGVAFTGGADAASSINRALAERSGPILPLIAETGGLNGLFVDTTALREQVVDDVIASAFGSAGQRCSSARLLFLPHETADGLIEAIAGAMDALVLGDPADPATDVGPIIDEAALGALGRHLARLRREAKVIRQCAAPEGGLFFGPVLAEVPTAGFLEREVFGPILHVVRYDPARLGDAARPLAASGYGLTLGVHSRLEGFADDVARVVPAGNFYVNRSIIGAVVGVQPFGGEGLSGTGPKAGGPNALLRYGVERARSVNTAAQGGDPGLFNLG
jgi:RHH-type proline utilization regulon transcriptional repressor/proline dehydrogenase/delta 1-pyrroline-5-carboxylate dehydrogenase